MFNMPHSAETSGAAFRIVVNGEARAIRARTLQALLAELGIESPFVGTAVNGELVRRSDRSRRPIAADDRVEILSPMQGG